MYIEKREIPISILLSLLTCGFYAIYWMYCILKDTYTLCNYTDGNPGIDLLLIFVTCGIYAFFLNYRIGKMQQYLRIITNKTYRDNSVVYIVLSVLGLAMVAYAIMQSELNEQIDYIRENGDAIHVNNVYEG